MSHPTPTPPSRTRPDAGTVDAPACPADWTCPLDPTVTVGAAWMAPGQGTLADVGVA